MWERQGNNLSKQQPEGEEEVAVVHQWFEVYQIDEHLIMDMVVIVKVVFSNKLTNQRKD